MADISWAACEYEDRGDGALILAPPEMTKGAFVEDLPRALVDALHAHNRTHGAEEQVRLRMALHAGEINYDDHGVTAAAINLAFRLLDAAPLKTELAGSSGVLAVITSSWFFEEVVRHSRVCDMTAYRSISVTVKETATTAWVHLPERHGDGPHDAPGSEGCPEYPEPTLLGRDQELVRLRRAASTARAGRFTLALVTGEPGIGKSALAGAVGRQLAADGWTIAWGNCPEREGSPAGQPWAEILQALVDRFPPRHHAVELAPLLDDHATLSAAGDVPAARFRLRTAVGLYLSAVARANPLLIVLDDLHHADGEVLALLTHLAGALVSEPVFLIATYRPTEVDEHLAEALATLARHQPEHVDLTGLDTEVVSDLMRALCARPLADDTVAAIARRTEGNPFFVREIARLLETGGEHAAIGEVPPSVRHIVRRRVARLSASAQTVLHHAAVIGRDFTIDVLAAVTGMDDDVLIECLDTALRAGLLVEPQTATRALRFAHALVRETLSTTSPSCAVAAFMPRSAPPWNACARTTRSHSPTTSTPPTPRTRPRRRPGTCGWPRSRPSGVMPTGRRPVSGNRPSFPTRTHPEAPSGTDSSS
ncbi:AAA family ATPase [Actinophytocola sp.]|uniref:ATP-binding protein n=1 Tax=Actinophytocola sp. TaxID=1872138 RepID=UPI0025C6CDFB|nr:AAA family ATPase [Actinophytocola sp.]